jgi:hypothetical protein
VLIIIVKLLSKSSEAHRCKYLSYLATVSCMQDGVLVRSRPYNAIIKYSSMQGRKPEGQGTLEKAASTRQDTSSTDK